MNARRLITVAAAYVCGDLVLFIAGLCSWLATQVAAIVVVLIILIRSRDVIAVVVVAAVLAHSMVLSIRPGDALLPDITVWRIAAPIIGALIVLLVVRAVRQPDRWVSTLLSITVVALFYGSTFLGSWVTYFPAGYGPICGG